MNPGSSSIERADGLVAGVWRLGAAMGGHMSERVQAIEYVSTEIASGSLKPIDKCNQPPRPARTFPILQSHLNSKGV